MGIGRRTVLAGGGVAAIAAATAGTRAEGAPANALAKLLTEDGRSIHAVRVTAGKDGHSQFEQTTIATDSPAGAKSVRFLNKKAAAVAVYSAPPGHKTPERPVSSAGTEILYIIRGSATLTSGTAKQACGAGTLVVFEDSSGSGHSERAGPQGYTAIRVRVPA